MRSRVVDSWARIGGGRVTLRLDRWMTNRAYENVLKGVTLVSKEMIQDSGVVNAVKSSRTSLNETVEVLKRENDNLTGRVGTLVHDATNANKSSRTLLDETVLDLKRETGNFMGRFGAAGNDARDAHDATRFAAVVNDSKSTETSANQMATTMRSAGDFSPTTTSSYHTVATNELPATPPNKPQPQLAPPTPIQNPTTPRHFPPAPARRIAREAEVPSSPLARVVEFGSLFTGLAMGTITETAKRVVGASTSTGNSVWLSEANADRLASSLCRMRGAALKLGQMLSIQDETVLPRPLAAALERVRAGADKMPEWQLNAVMSQELGGPDWESRCFLEFDRVPIAAASLGQVHRAIAKSDGQLVVVKVQYPGVAESIESDVANLRRVVRLTGMFPKGLFIETILDVLGSELKEECDYVMEAHHQTEFAKLLEGAGERYIRVPKVYPDLSTHRVLTMEYAPGVPLDQVANESQAVRNFVGRNLLRLTLRELFDFGYVQTDPNFSNYAFDRDTKTLWLLDFGAARKYSDEFVNKYARLVWAAAQHDRQKLLEQSLDLKMLSGQESEEMINAHVLSAFEIAEPFAQGLNGGFEDAYDFSKSTVSAKVARHGPIFLRDRLIPPPQEIYSLHRKLSGAFMACVKIKAKFPCRDLLRESLRNRGVM